MEALGNDGTGLPGGVGWTGAGMTPESRVGVLCRDWVEGVLRVVSGRIDGRLLKQSCARECFEAAL